MRDRRWLLAGVAAILLGSPAWAQHGSFFTAPKSPAAPAPSDTQGNSAPAPTGTPPATTTVEPSIQADPQTAGQPVPPVSQPPPSNATAGPPPSAPSQVMASPAPQPAPPITPVDRLEDVPPATWRNLSIFVGQHYGLDRISRLFLSQFVALDNCAAWQQDRASEFAMEDRRRAIKSYLATATPPARVRVPLRIHLQEYDFDKGGFPLPAIGPGTGFSVPTRAACPSVTLSPGIDDIPSEYALRLVSPAPWPSLLQVPMDRARMLVSQLPPNRIVHAELVVDLLDLDPQANFKLSTIQVRPVAILVWLDDRQERFIGASGAVGPGLDAALDAPASAASGNALPRPSSGPTAAVPPSPPSTSSSTTSAAPPPAISPQPQPPVPLSFVPPSPATNSDAALAGCGATRDKVLAFMQDYFAHASAGLAEVMEYDRRTYADQIEYYGKPFTLRDLLLDKENYVKRWPIRSNFPNPASISIRCDQATLRYIFTASTVFHVSSPGRTQGPTQADGTTILTLGLTYDPRTGRMIITQETSVKTSG